ncbi:MAG: fumarylacetoacetate hydrolase family protein [Deinococcota bacterium]|nr:fumarylacetoacetate hydrolase family protein [Deinococcota bacterium]
MKRIRYRTYNGAHWGEVEGGKVFQLSRMMGRRTGASVMLSDVTLLPPCEPRTIICVGKNYARHIAEMGGGDLPGEPGLFLKAPNTLIGPGDPIPYPSWTNELHFEGELAVVISRTMTNVGEEEALEYVLGYGCACDVTARDKQRSDLQWVRGKSADGFLPLGPWLETDLDPGALSVQTRVNGELKQDGNTNEMIFPVPVILSYISRFMTLEPGDVVLTGTPDGVGPLQPGDVIEVSVEGVGTLQNPVEAA